MPYPYNEWYCVAFAHEIDDKPIVRRILNIPILLTRDSDGEVRALHDRCPHRFAPLHKGLRIGDTIECPYHGLRFDLSGACVLNPHASGRIPAAAKVQAFPTVESGRFIWLWPGNPDLADPTMVPDLHLFENRDLDPVLGHVNMPVNYQLVLDNLLDLSHAGYIHAGTLSPARSGSNVKVQREVKNEAGARSVKVSAKVSGVPTPSSQALFFDSEIGDFHSQIEWLAPGTLRHRLSMTEPGRPFESGAQSRLAHLITPESEISTHYFWTHTRNARADDKAIDEQTKAIITNAFVNEDEPMIQACQDYMEGHEFFSLRPLYLETDFAGTRCRRMLEKIIAAEQGLTVAEDHDTMA